MTTPSSKRVNRVTDEAYSSRILGSRPRKIIVSIAGKYIIFRQQRCKQVFVGTIVELMEYLVSREVLHNEAAAKARRAAKRKKK